MKKVFLIIAVILMGISAYAQPRAVGVNIGAGGGLNYQHAVGDGNMVDANANLSILHGGSGALGLGLTATVTYDWINPGGHAVPWNGKGSWDWYVGVGGAVGSSNFTNTDLSVEVGVAGHIGIEYIINHFALSFDYRPNIGVCIGVSSEDQRWTPRWNTWGMFDGIGIGLKYHF